MGDHIGEGEFRQRLRNIRDGMRHQHLDALLVYSQKRGHVTYVSGYHPNYHTNCAVALLPLERDPSLWIKFPFDLPRAKQETWFADIRGSYREDTGHMIAECAKEIGSLNLGRSRIGLVASDLAVDEMSHSLYEYLRNQLRRADLRASSDLLNGLRLIKSQNEIKILRDATQLAELVAERLRQTIRPGVKDRVAAVTAENAGRLEGADSCSIILSTGPARLALPPCGAEFQKGSPVCCEITVQYQGYWVQICRVFSVGRASAPQREVFEVCQNAYEAAVRVARPGSPVARLLEEAHKVIADGGFKDCIQYGAGHGVGLDLPELYSVERDCSDRLRPGVVLEIHPGIWVPGKGAAFVGGPIVITEDGPLRLDKPQSEIIEI